VNIPVARLDGRFATELARPADQVDQLCPARRTEGHALRVAHVLTWRFAPLAPGKVAPSRLSWKLKHVLELRLREPGFDRLASRDAPGLVHVGDVSQEARPATASELTTCNRQCQRSS
jgi:hypothetical protein